VALPGSVAITATGCFAMHAPHLPAQSLANSLALLIHKTVCGMSKFHGSFMGYQHITAMRSIYYALELQECSAHDLACAIADKQQFYEAEAS